MSVDNSIQYLKGEVSPPRLFMGVQCVRLVVVLDSVRLVLDPGLGISPSPSHTPNLPP